MEKFQEEEVNTEVTKEGGLNKSASVYVKDENWMRCLCVVCLAKGEGPSSLLPLSFFSPPSPPPPPSSVSSS